MIKVNFISIFIKNQFFFHVRKHRRFIYIADIMSIYIFFQGRGHIRAEHQFPCSHDLLGHLDKINGFGTVSYKHLVAEADGVKTLGDTRGVPAKLCIRDRSMDAEVGFEWNRVLAMSLLAIIPSLVVFFAAQDSFVEGIAAGGVKG